MRVMAETENQTYAAYKAGVSVETAHNWAHDPDLRRAIIDEQIMRLTTRTIPNGIGALDRIIEGDTSRDSDKIQATKAASGLLKDLQAAADSLEARVKSQTVDLAALIAQSEMLKAKADAIEAELMPTGGVFD